MNQTKSGNVVKLEAQKWNPGCFKTVGTRQTRQCIMRSDYSGHLCSLHTTYRSIPTSSVSFLSTSPFDGNDREGDSSILTGSVGACTNLNTHPRLFAVEANNLIFYFLVFWLFLIGIFLVFINLVVGTLIKTRLFMASAPETKIKANLNWNAGGTVLFISCGV